jgi:UDP-N-acetylglucosamine--N-acetylmuramyl-(pentapeptide) pyrophosphoryl-undecaprenol N-acetylglucosamine transferase
MHPALIATLSPYSTIVLVGGGTGWHIQPIVSIVKSLEHEYLWIGWQNSTEEKSARENNIPFHQIPTLKLSTTKSFKVVLYPYFLLLGFFKARKLLKWLQTWWKTVNSGGCVFSKGWPGSVAIGIAAWSLWIPLYIHESDTVAGRSNQILGKFATKVFLGFENTKKYFKWKNSEVIGQILDPVFYRHCEPVKQSRNTEIQKPLDHFVPRDDRIQWKTNKPHILVICGSQGSQSIFQAIIEQFREDTRYEWIIALGKLNQDMQNAFAVIPNCQAKEWISQSDIAELIPDTDIAISRWSATTLAELTAFSDSKPHLIIIPLPYSAWNHQHFNALEYSKLGHTILEQKHLDTLNNILTTHFTTICPKQTQK